MRKKIHWRIPNHAADSEDEDETESVEISENASDVFLDAIPQSPATAEIPPPVAASSDPEEDDIASDVSYFDDETHDLPRAEKRKRDLEEVYEGSEASIQARVVCPNRACRVAFFFPIAAPIVRCHGCGVEYDSDVLNVAA